MSSVDDLLELLADLDPEELADLIATLPEPVVAALSDDLGAVSTRNLPGTLLAQALEVDERYRPRPHLEYLSERVTRAVRDVEAGRNRMLAVSMPPRSGKSLALSFYLPLWLLRAHPDWPIASVSHDPALSGIWAKQLRSLIEARPDLGISLAPEFRGGMDWRTIQGGGMYATSVRGAFTGRGAKCVSGDTHIECEYGTVTAADAYGLGIRRILAYDPATGQAIWREVEAAQRTPGRRVITVTTVGGRTLTCTPDHPIHTGRGYVPAGDLRPGETLLALVASGGVSLRGPMGGSEVRGSEGDTARAESLLLPRMSPGRGGGSAADTVLSRMRRSLSDQRDEHLLLKGLSGGSQGAASHLQSLPNLRPDLQGPVVTHGLLFPPVRQHRTLQAHGRQGQLPLQDGHELRALVPDDAAADPGTRRPQVRDLLGCARNDLQTRGQDGCEVRPVCAPHRRGQHEQLAHEPHHTLQDVPCDPPQVCGDTVASVSGVGGEPVSVYDFQVAGARNFFGDGLLVHNCLIIDDPIKDFVEAHSPTIRQAVWDWWLSVALTRLEPPFFVVMVMTRWHTDDVLGRALSPEWEGDPADWEQVNLPAVARADDAMGRAEGEPLLSPLLDETPKEATGRWGQVLRAVGTYVFSAMYQGRPAPAKGAIFDVGWWRYWTSDPSKATDDGRVTYLNPATLTGGRWLDSWDTSFDSAGATSSYVVGQRWVKSGPSRYLIAQQRDRWEFTATLERMRAWCNGGGPHGRFVHLRLIEKKANGAAIISVLKREVAGLKATVPTAGKEARARAVTPECESGDVYLPHPGDPGNEWVADLLSELRNFPFDANDDQVDALTQALLELREAGRGLVSVPGRMPQPDRRAPVRRRAL